MPCAPPATRTFVSGGRPSVFFVKKNKVRARPTVYFYKTTPMVPTKPQHVEPCEQRSIRCDGGIGSLHAVVVRGRRGGPGQAGSAHVQRGLGPPGGMDHGTLEPSPAFGCHVLWKRFDPRPGRASQHHGSPGRDHAPDPVQAGLLKPGPSRVNLPDLSETVVLGGPAPAVVPGSVGGP